MSKRRYVTKKDYTRDIVLTYVITFVAVVIIILINSLGK